MANPADWKGMLARYGEHLHAAAGDTHHVVSPLGAWMVIALCGELAKVDPVAGKALGAVLGCEPPDAAAFAGELLRHPHPLVAAGAALWVRAYGSSPEMMSWQAGLPEEVDTGDIPTQEKADRWAAERTLGLIRAFPLEVTPEVVCILASALATKVSWEVPFHVVGAAELGPHRWGQSVTRVLRTPPDWRHRQFLTDTEGAGPVAVHLGQARGGLLVGSVIAANDTISAASVLREAERIVTAEATQAGSVDRLSLFQLPLGSGPVWEITEESDRESGWFQGRERFTTVMPAWTAQTELDLGDSPELGFETAAGMIAKARQMDDWRFAAKQSAAATYNTVGFEAAAVTAVAVAASARIEPAGLPRRAAIRFRHPYAVVAATHTDPRDPSPSCWRGLPVFSAWVAEAHNAEPPGDPT